MAGLVHSIEELVGRTPLMELDRFERQQQCGAHLLAKLEFFNPTGSVKDRAALSMMAFCRRMMCRKAHFPTICGQTGAMRASMSAPRKPTKRPMRCCGRKDCFWAHRQQRLCTQRCRWAADRRIRERTSWSSSRTTA